MVLFFIIYLFIIVIPLFFFFYVSLMHRIGSLKNDSYLHVVYSSPEDNTSS